MYLGKLAEYIERVARLVEANEAQEDGIAGIGAAIVQAQQHYTQPCGGVVAALELKSLTVREARAALANAKAALPQCGNERIEPELLTVKQARQAIQYR